MTFMSTPPASDSDATVGVEPPTRDELELSDLRAQARLTLKMVAQLFLIAGPCAAAALLVHSTALIAAVGAIVVLGLLLTFPAASSVRWLAAILAFTPDTIVVLHSGGSPVSLRMAVFAALAAVTLLAGMRGRLRLSVPAPVLMAAICLTTLIGTLQAGRSRSLVEFTVMMVMPPIIGASLGTDRRLAVEFLRGLTAGTVVVVAFAIFERIKDKDYITAASETVTFVRAGHVRANAGWDYPTTLAAFLCLAGFFLIQVLRNRWGFFGLAIGGTSVAAALLATQARSGLLGFAAGALVYLLLQRRASQGLAVLLGLAAMIGLLFILPGAAPSSFRKFLGQSFTPGSAANSNVHYRQQLYTDAHAAVAQHPWVGFGYGTGKSVATNALSQYFGSLTDLASLPVSLAVQIGLIGTAAVFLFLVLAVIRVARAGGVPNRQPIVAGIVACMVAMLGVPVTPPLSWMLLVAGVGWSLARGTREAGPPADAPPSAPNVA